ncbi:transcription initiation factor IIE, beta subunit [Amniculicola lignicola CBS 123094]|uniref:Transcription initiation factor IIE subunit beta n=1 Tax=Amniculicola lignicola CBS 123094 TaxID=1392246 RepID=A0A6A5VZ54_9PLEO|nr:transcription initiation factor IIE, beta subunit [Amniculicola lignicola CBS 123094]
MSSLKPGATARLAAPSPTPSTSSNGGMKRKRVDVPAANIVYSQPTETGTGEHIYTQVTYTIEHLRNQQKWLTLKEVFDYLNIHNQKQREQLQAIYSSPQTDRIEYNYTNNTLRYRPKYNIRNAAQLKGYLQSQKSAQGLPLRDLRDGWANVLEDIKQLEDKKEVLVKRNPKDNTAKTVWINDPSLMHKVDEHFKADWHQIQIPQAPDELRNKLMSVGLKPSSAPREIVSSKPKDKKRKAARRGGKQTNTHMTAILKDFSHLRK